MVAKIHIGGAGGAPSNNLIRSLRESSRRDYLIGTSTWLPDLCLADTDEKYLVLPAMHPDYPRQILALLKKTRPAMIHVQNDFEVRALSRLRDEVQELGVRLYLPSKDTVENCVDKYKSYVFWKEAGLPVPRTLLLNDTQDLRKAFDTLGDKLWIRAIEGGGGAGALPTGSFEFARMWIDRFKGWGRFSAAEQLTDQSVTWMSIWHEGDLVVAQGRKRRSWSFWNRTLSGVTGVTGVGETVSDPVVDRSAMDAILAIDSKPHGLFGVDMTYDSGGVPNPTEINIGRFFTTVYFFTRAGLNLPEIYCDIALDKRFPSLEKKINPLPEGLVWIRQMDREPVLTTVREVEKAQQDWVS